MVVRVFLCAAAAAAVRERAGDAAGGEAAADAAAAAAPPPAAARGVACPAALDTRAWAEHVPAENRVWYEKARPDNVVFNRRGSVQGQDVRGIWFDMSLMARNADGTYSGFAYDNHAAGEKAPPPGAGEYWDKTWLDFMRVRREAPPEHPFIPVTRSGCRAFPAACAPRLPRRELQRMDQACGVNLPAAFWGRLNRTQTLALSTDLLSWGLPAASCAQFPPHAVSHLGCEAAVSDDCALGFAAETLRMLPARCVARISRSAFARMNMDQVASIAWGTGNTGLSPAQLHSIQPEACSKLTSDWTALHRLGAHGAELCSALPRECWTYNDATENAPDSDVPQQCFASLPPDAIHDMAAGMAAGKSGPNAYKLCDMGRMLATLNPAQRAAFPTVMCAPCLSQHGDAFFPQCRGIRPTSYGLARLVSLPHLSTIERLVLATAVCAAFFAGIALGRRRAA